MLTVSLTTSRKGWVPCNFNCGQPFNASATPSAYTDLDQGEVRHRQQRGPSQEEDRDLHREVLRDVEAPAAHGRGGVGPGVQRGADVAGRVYARARPEAGP